MSRLARLFRNRIAFASATAVVLLIAFSVIHLVAREAAAKPATAQEPLTPVSVEIVEPREVRVWSTFSGRMQAVDYAQIRPEVSGRIVEVRFKEGQIVKAGEVLMVIDPKPYEAAVERAEAAVASAYSKAQFAKRDLVRTGILLKSHAVPQRLYDERADDSRVADADLKAANANLALATVDLDRAYVKAPIPGRISRAEVTTGNLVQAGPNAQVLTSIVSNNGIYADFDVDEQTYLTSVRSRTSTRKEEHTIPVELIVPGDEGHPYEGHIDSFDNHIDTATGTIRARALFANADSSLVPGMFVSVKMAGNGAQNAIVIPERAISDDQSKKYVLIVDADSKVAYRGVTVGPEVGEGLRVVSSGLNPGDRVIVDGLQHVRPGMRVQINTASTKVASVDR